MVYAISSLIIVNSFRIFRFNLHQTHTLIFGIKSLDLLTYAVYELQLEVLGTDIYMYILWYLNLYILDMEMKTHKVLFKFGKSDMVLLITHYSFCVPQYNHFRGNPIHYDDHQSFDNILPKYNIRLKIQNEARSMNANRTR